MNLKPAAYLLHSGRLYLDRASTHLIHAEKDRKDRNDGSQIEPLYRHSDVAPLVEAVRAYESECANPVMDPVLKRKCREAMFSALSTLDADGSGV